MVPLKKFDPIPSTIRFPPLYKEFFPALKEISEPNICTLSLSMTSNENDEKAEAERCAQEMSLVYDMLQRLDSSDGDVSKKVERKR